MAKMRRPFKVGKIAGLFSYVYLGKMLNMPYNSVRRVFEAHCRKIGKKPIEVTPQDMLEFLAQQAISRYLT